MPPQALGPCAYMLQSTQEPQRLKCCVCPEMESCYSQRVCVCVLSAMHYVLERDRIRGDTATRSESPSGGGMGRGRKEFGQSNFGLRGTPTPTTYKTEGGRHVPGRVQGTENSQCHLSSSKDKQQRANSFRLLESPDRGGKPGERLCFN